VGPDGEYVRFLRATLDLVDVSEQLPRRVRRRMEIALLQAWESDGQARMALIDGRPERLARAAARVRSARGSLAEAGSDVTADAARRRLIALV
jgi:hypothetical protein